MKHDNLLPMFRDLSLKEISEFKRWARENYESGDVISEVWHPVIKEECYLIKIESLYNKESEKDIIK